MKIKVNQKTLKENYKNIICIGYCNIQYLLNGIEPRFYGCGVYGWNWDGYELDGSTLIVTGYRPFGNVRIDYKIQQKYEEKARKIWLDNSIPYQKQKAKSNKLLEKFIEEGLKNE